MKALTQVQIHSCRANGLLFPIPALTPEEVATRLAGLDRLETELCRGITGRPDQVERNTRLATWRKRTSEASYGAAEAQEQAQLPRTGVQPR